MNYTRLTPAQSAEARASYRAALVISRERRRVFLLRRDTAAAFRAMYWGPEASEELAQLFIYRRMP
jgi:hypothetical protein